MPSLGIERVPDERLTKLPVYAQDEILMSRRRIEELTAELNALVNPDHAVSTHADPYADRPKPIGDYPTIRHRLADGSELTIECDPHRLNITASGQSYHQQPVVIPQVSNVLAVAMADTRTLPADPRPGRK